MPLKIIASMICELPFHMHGTEDTTIQEELFAMLTTRLTDVSYSHPGNQTKAHLGHLEEEKSNPTSFRANFQRFRQVLSLQGH